MGRILLVFTAIGCLFLGPVQLVLARDAARRAQVEAATADAVDELVEEIRRMQIDNGLSVADFLDQTDGRKMLIKALQRGEQIGPPRWVDEYTVQVQLEIAGARVAEALGQIAAAASDRSPIPVAAVLEKTRQWHQRTFTATGMSMAAARLEHVRPAADDEVWVAINDSDRRHAIIAARDNAIHRVIDSLRPVSLTEQQTLGEAMEQSPQVPEALRQWLEQRPVTQIEFRPDLQVEVVLSVPAEGLFEILHPALMEHAAVELAEDQWQAVRDRVGRHVARAVGRGKLPEQARLHGRVRMQARPAAHEVRP